MSAAETRDRPRVGLFVTCLVDLMRPSVGFAAIKLLEDAGCRVEVPRAQTCCGQPAFNSGDYRANSQVTIARTGDFETFCRATTTWSSLPRVRASATIKHPLSESCLPNDPELARSCRPAASRASSYRADLSFLTEVRGVRRWSSARYEGKVQPTTIACSGLRELGSQDVSRAELLASVQGLELLEIAGQQRSCCGFGGTFCVKYPEISNAMVAEKCRKIDDSGAELLLAGDLGCLMNMAGKLKREGKALQVRHVAEVLAGMVDQPAIGEPKR